MKIVAFATVCLWSSFSFAADLKITVSDDYRVISDKVTNDQSIVVLRRNPLAYLAVYNARTYLVQARPDFTPIKETPVVHPSGVKGAYDEQYVGIGGAVQLHKKIVAVFHGEHLLPDELRRPGTQDFGATVGAAVSTDGGFSFKKLGPAITSWRDEPWKPGVKHCLGNADPTLLVDHTGKYLLCYYGEHSRKNPVTGRWRSVITCVARSKISDEGRPGTWHKYFEGEFGEPGLKGKDTKVVNCWCPNVQYLPRFKKYVLLGCRGGIVFSQSDDGIHWKKIEYLWQIADIPVKQGAWDQHPCFYVTQSKAGVVQGYLFYEHQVQGEMTFRAKTFRLTVEDEP